MNQVNDSQYEKQKGKEEGDTKCRAEGMCEICLSLGAECLPGKDLRGKCRVAM